jgi:hypothetical protein
LRNPLEPPAYASEAARQRAITKRLVDIVALAGAVLALLVPRRTRSGTFVVELRPRVIRGLMQQMHQILAAGASRHALPIRIVILDACYCHEAGAGVAQGFGAAGLLLCLRCSALGKGG